jgi:hypothetical protein
MNKTKLILALISLVTVQNSFAMTLEEEQMAQVIQHIDAQVAQEGEEPSQAPAEETKLTIDPSKYSLYDYSEMLINGQKYHRITFAPKADFASMNSGTGKNLLLMGSFLTDAFMGVAAYGWEPNMKTYPSNLPKPDKVKHVMMGYAIGNLANGFFQVVLPDNMRFRRLTASVLGLATATAVGIAKEVRDARCNCGTPEVADAVATMIGGAVGTLTLSFDIRSSSSAALKAPF